MVALVGEDGEGVVKRFRRECDMLSLVSENPNYTDVWRPGEYNIIGKVVALVRQFA